MFSITHLKILALVALVAICSNSLGSAHPLGGVAPEDGHQLEQESQPELGGQPEPESQPEVGAQSEIGEQSELVTVHTSSEQDTDQQPTFDPRDYVQDEEALARMLENSARTSPDSANSTEEAQPEQGDQSEENDQSGSETPHTSTELAPLQHPSFNAEDYVSDEAAFERLLERMRWEEYNRYFHQSLTEGASKQTDLPTEARTDSSVAGSDIVTESQETSADCPICLNPMEDSDTTETPCKHLFHAECIDMWLASRKVSNMEHRVDLASKKSNKIIVANSKIVAR